MKTDDQYLARSLYGYGHLFSQEEHEFYTPQDFPMVKPAVLVWMIKDFVRFASLRMTIPGFFTTFRMTFGIENIDVETSPDGLNKVKPKVPRNFGGCKAIEIRIFGFQNEISKIEVKSIGGINCAKKIVVKIAKNI